ncbi:MAG: ATP-binding protein [Bacilli bacterium]|nr:ATP-binding protein [Bacilli bacterium]
MDEKAQYIPRLFDDVLDFALKSKGAVVVEGPKWCGKSTTCQRHANTVVDLMPLETRQQYVDYAKVAPHEFLNDGEHPLLIDEWQHIYFIWDQIKVEVDRIGRFGQYILTGSVTDKAIMDASFEESRHTGNGRIIRKFMRTMSLFESGDSDGSVSLSDLKNGIFKPHSSQKRIADYAFYICRGGWPLALCQDREVALQQAIDFYEITATDDIFSLKTVPIRKDETKARQILRSYARNVSIAAGDQTLLGDCIGEGETFDKEAFAKYIQALKYLHVIEELPAWNPNLRSKTAIRSKPTRHFVDPSIGAAALGVSPEGLFRDIATFGLMFESLAVRDLRVYGDTMGAHLYKYRDAKKREADAVMQFKDGSWALFEVKLGGNEDIEDAAKKLLAIANDIDAEKTGNPSFLMVITKGPLAYRRPDGVYVVPLACLKP